MKPGVELLDYAFKENLDEVVFKYVFRMFAVFVEGLFWKRTMEL